MAKTNDFGVLAVMAAVALAAALLVLFAAGEPAQAAFPGTNGLIAFASDLDYDGLPDDVYVMDADPATYDAINLTNNPANDSEPAFSADGSKIAFTSDRDLGNQEIYAMNADGSGQIGLTDGADTYSDSEPSFSPDGSKIAFTSYFRCLVDHFCSDILSRGISVMNADGSGRTVLSDSGTDYSPSGASVNPRWIVLLPRAR